MTPKEKAEELYLKYKKALNITHDMRPEANPFAKECALIAVDEIINQYYTHTDNVTQHEYWQQVKQEIDKL